MKRGLEQDQNEMVHFYTMIKMNKDRCIYQSIIATRGRALSILSSWLDYKLKQLLLFVKSLIPGADVNKEES